MLMGRIYYEPQTPENPNVTSFPNDVVFWLSMLIHGISLIKTEGTDAISSRVYQKWCSILIDCHIHGSECG